MEPALRKTYANIISENIRCLSHEKEEELLNRLRETNIWAALLQETWRENKTAWENIC
jgi:hypothetical protein